MIIVSILSLIASSSSSPALMDNHHSDNSLVADAPGASTTTEEKNSSHGTTSFVDNDQISFSSARTVLDIQSLGPPKFDSNSIPEFLGKPRIVQKGTFTNQAASTDLFSSSILALLFSNPLWMNKIQGYNLFRGTACFKLVINANPFQQGRLMLRLFPNVNTSVTLSGADAALLKMHNIDLLQKTQHPHVELDLRETSCVLKCPYITPTSHLDMSQKTYDWGNIYLTVLSPLVVGAAAPLTVDYTLFMYFEDVELTAPYFAQSSSSLTPMHRGFAKAVSVQSDEIKDANPNVVRGVLSTVKAANQTLGAIPGYSIVGGVVDKALDIGGKVASFFGFSKPLNVSPITLVGNRPFHQAMNINGVTNSAVLAFNGDSHVETIPGFAGAAVDEMSFEYLKGLPVYMDNFTITTSQPQDTLLYTAQVSPYEQNNAYTKSGAHGTALWNTYGPIAYLSQFFQLWRGGITYTFKFVKTDFHSCRLMFIFTPLSTTVSGHEVTNSESDYCLREIVDLRTDSEFTVTTPWLLNSPWLDTNNMSDSYNGIRSGTVSVRILNPLQAPDTCAQNIQVMVYMSGGPDLEFAVPRSDGSYPIYRPEANFGVSNPIANSTVSQSAMANVACVGDKITSVKQLLNMLCRLTVTVPTNPNVNFYPFTQSYCMSDVANSSVITYSNVGRDYLDYFTQGYSLSRGGVRVVIPPQSGGGTTQMDGFSFSQFVVVPPAAAAFTMGTTNSAFALPSPAYYAPGSTTSSLATYIGPSAVQPNSGGGIDVIAPHASTMPMRINRPRFVQGTNQFWYPDESRSYLMCQSSSNKVTMYRSGADDYQLGYFIGFPPLLYSWVGIASTPTSTPPETEEKTDDYVSIEPTRVSEKFHAPKKLTDRGF